MHIDGKYAARYDVNANEPGSLLLSSTAKMKMKTIIKEENNNDDDNRQFLPTRPGRTMTVGRCSAGIWLSLFITQSSRITPPSAKCNSSLKQQVQINSIYPLTASSVYSHRTHCCPCAYNSFNK
jgi:hypothetical protein